MAVELPPPLVGAAVYAHDGEKLGQVKAVEGRFFQVGVRLKPDYWLDRTDIASIEEADGSVHMAFDRAQLADRRLKEPSLI